MRRSLCTWLTLGLLVYVVSASQAFLDNGLQEPYNLGVSSMNLSDVSHDFTVLSHPRFPTHQVRIKRSDFCDPTVKVWTGRIMIDWKFKRIAFSEAESRIYRRWFRRKTLVFLLLRVSSEPRYRRCCYVDQRWTWLFIFYGVTHGTWYLNHFYAHKLLVS